MTVTARVEAVRENRIRACYRRAADQRVAGPREAGPQDSGSTAGCGGCTLCLLGRPEAKTTIEAENRRNLPVEVGDTVEIFLSPAKAIKAAFFILILPLLLFLALYGVGKELIGIESEGANVLIGASGLIGGLLLNLAAKKLRRAPDLPEVTRIVDDVSAAPEAAP